MEARAIPDARYKLLRPHDYWFELATRLTYWLTFVSADMRPRGILLKKDAAVWLFDRGCSLYARLDVGVYGP